MKKIIYVLVFVLTITIAYLVCRSYEIKNCSLAPHKTHLVEGKEMDYRKRCADEGWKYVCRQGPIVFSSPYAVVENDLCDWTQEEPYHGKWQLVDEYNF